MNGIPGYPKSEYVQAVNLLIGTEKECQKCGVIKKISDFYKDKSKESGISSRCKECQRAIKNKWRLSHPGRANENCKKWRSRHPEKVKEIARKSYKKQISTPRGKVNSRMKNATKRLLTKGTKAKRHWENLVGFTAGQLINHLEKHFTSGMTWDNYGEWHIDHIIPISAFNFECPDDTDFRKCWVLKNLQPLWAVENQSKNDKLDRPFQPSLTI